MKKLCIFIFAILSFGCYEPASGSTRVDEQLRRVAHRTFVEARGEASCPALQNVYVSTIDLPQLQSRCASQSDGIL